MSTADIIALMSAQALPSAQADGDVPEWVHLLPTSSGAIETGDNRGPYHVTDAVQMIADSLADGERLPIDENHATDLAAPLGHPAPARGWIVEMQARADGIWGRVEWNGAGRDLVASRAYRALSPVISHDKAKNVLRILRASLVNRPNLRGLTALNMESDEMSFMEKLAKALGLREDATEDEIMKAIGALKSDRKGDGDAKALQARLSEIGTALGVEGDGDVLAAARAAAGADGSGEMVTALQAQVAELSTSLTALTQTTTRKAAESFVDGEIKRGRVGVKSMRDHYIAMHMEDAARVEKEIGALPVLSGTMLQGLPPAAKDGEIALNAEQAAVAGMLGLDPEKYRAQLKADRANEEAL